MSLFSRWRGLSRSQALDNVVLICPKCGNAGTDRGTPTDGDSEAGAAFGVRGQDGGKPVRECLGCHEWWMVSHGGRLLEIPRARQEAMKAHFAAHEAASEERMKAFSDRYSGQAAESDES